MTAAPEPLAELRRLLDEKSISAETFKALAAALKAQASSTSHQAELDGSGAMAQGLGATALGAGATQINGDFHGTLNLDVIIQQARQPGASMHILRRAYLARLLLHTNQLPLLAGEQGSEQVQLSQVYTALLTQRSAADGAGKHGLAAAADDEQRARPLSALAVLDAEPRLVLMAGPGGGKSTFVNVVAMSLAGELLGRQAPNLATLVAPLPHGDDRKQDEPPKPQPWRHGPLLPVLVLLRDLASQLPPPGTPIDADTLWRFITGRLQQATLGDFAPHLHEQLLQQGGLVLLDGLDEVPDAQGRRVQIKQAVQAFAAIFRHCRLLVTSRTYAYQKQDWKLDGFAEVQLRPFNDAQIACFVDAWYGHMAALARLTTADAKDRAATLKAEVRRNPRLRELAGRPLLLTLIAQLQTKGGGALPQRREALYDAAVTMLLDTWEKLKPRTAPDGTAYQEPSLSEYLQVGIEQIRRQLNRLAFEAHRDQPNLVGSADIPQAHLLQALMAASPGNQDVKVARLQEYLHDRAGILSEHGVGTVQFPHRSFQEYLAACHLTNDDYPNLLAELTRANPNRWREVALLAGAKAARGAEHSAWLLAETLSHEPAPQPETDLFLPAAAWGALLAGQVLVESAQLSELARRDAAKRDRIRDWNAALLQRPGLPAADRALAGHHLAVLGDTRPEVMTLDGMQFVAVSPGSFWMGDDDDGDATPCHLVELKQAYAIGRHPVSVAQWLEYQSRLGPAAGHPDSRQAGPGNTPVVRVSWHEALAFCTELTEAWQGRLPPGWVATLPSEAEWEKASRGGEQVPVNPAPFTINQVVQRLQPGPAGAMQPNPLPRRLFPWGDEFDADRANTESAIGAPSAMGAFSLGTSPVGAQDMAGNVWEWTRSLYGKGFWKPDFKYPY